jgi:hypothetical protein
MDRQRIRKKKDLRLVEKLGLMHFWRATKSQPDACETEDVPFCRELKTAAKP